MTAAGWAGFYWSSSPDPFDMSSAYCAYFGPDNVNPAINDFRFCGYSVRLVTETAPASVTLPKAVAGLTANGEAQTLITAGECEDGTLYYSLDKENWSTDLPTGTGAQDYTVYYYVKGDANHNDSEVNSLTASIGTLPQALLGLVYTGEAQTLVTAGDVEGFTYQYKVGDAEYSTDLPTATDAGSYTVYYKATAAGEQDITGSLNATIAKADIDVNGGGASEAPEGALKGAFSVADGKVVNFSKGNLQATTADLGANWTWAFAANQYDLIGSAVANTKINDNGTVSANGTVDLFGWSTTSTYYGIYNNNSSSTYSGEFKDWGATMGAGWRTLTKDEWAYLLNTRTNAADKLSQAIVNGVRGLVVLPDDWTLPEGCSFTAGSENSFESNEYFAEGAVNNWSAMEAAGAIFLPAVGLRDGTSVSDVGSAGLYWSSTPSSSTISYDLCFTASACLPENSYYLHYGLSVRLVTETALASSVTLPQAVEELVYTSDKQALISAGECADGTFLYKVGENGTWVDTLPKVTDAGAYQVYYKIQGDANHNDYIAAEPLEVSIAKAALTITAENKEVVYGYAAPGFSVSYSGLKGSDLPADVLTGELSYACDYTVGSNVASYDVTPSGQTSANYDITYVNGKLVVYKADPAFTEPVANTLTYNGGAQTLVAAGTTEHGTFEYTFTPNDDESWNTALPQAKNADTYGVYYRVVGDANHLDYESADAVVVTIAKAALTATADNKEVIYGDAVPEYTVTYEGWQGEDNADVLSGTIAYACEYAPTSNVGDYDIIPSGVSNPDYAITFVNGKVTVSKAALTITADDKSVIYGDEAPLYTAKFEGFKNEDDELELDVMDYVCAYEQGSPVGTYTITPAAEDINYEITVVPATLTVNKATVYVSGAEAQIAKFEDGNTNAVVLNAGQLEGVQLNDAVAHKTTASFSDASVGEGKTITLFYELTGDAELLANYDLTPASDVFSAEGVIIEKFIPDNNPDEKDDEAEVKEGIEVHAYGYCDGSGYSLRYHLNSGNPDQYKIEFADPRFTDVDWTNLTTPGKDGIIDIEIPVDMPTGDYTFTATFRDSRFDWLESNALNVTFHVNLPETYVVALFDDVMAVVDTCECLTDIQWYWRANSTDQWQAIEGATGYYYKQEGGLSGEYFIHAKMNGVPTYTCPQEDLSLYGDTKQAKVSAYPNPVVNTTTVTIENSYNYEHTLRVVNFNGWEVLRSTFEGNETKVDMGGYMQGNYMISVDGIVVKVMKK